MDTVLDVGFLTGRYFSEVDITFLIPYKFNTYPLFIVKQGPKHLK